MEGDGSATAQQPLYQMDLEDPGQPLNPKGNAAKAAQSESFCAQHSSQLMSLAGALFGITVIVLIVVTHDPPNAPDSQKYLDAVNHSFASLVSDDAALEANIKRLMSQMDATRIRGFMADFASVPHIAGSKQNNDLADVAAANFRAFGFDAVQKQVIPALLANYTRRSVNVTSTADPSFFYACQLNEDNVLNQTDWDLALRPANGYSGDGVAEGPVVWANYGRKEDFDAIAHIDLTGMIVVVRYGAIFRGDKVKMAEERGAAGVLLVNDPYDVAKGAVFPNGPWAANTTVQRGSVYKGEGDPLTPTWPSEFGGPTLPQDALYDDAVMEGWALPRIPVQPMGYGDAAKVLQNIAGSPTINPLPVGWENTGFASLVSGGIGPGAARVRMEVRRTLQQFNITNVFATIYGAIEPDRTVLIGSHRDAWTYGAEDPISGHSVIQEIARNVGALRQTGWRPRRTIQFCSWDAEEWAIIGSIEYVESVAEQLRQRAAAYLNVDVAVNGNRSMYFEGSPLLKSVAERAASEVPLPGNESFSLLSITSPYGAAGAGSDHVGFVQLAGVPVVLSQIYNDPDPYKSVYHSNHDSLYWVENFGDPGFVYHRAMAQFHVNMLLRLADATLLPMRVSDYALKVLEWGREYQVPANSFADFSYLNRVSQQFAAAATQHDQRRADVTSRLAADAQSVSPLEIRALNDITMGVERCFLAYGKKETGQNWYKHVIFTPSAVDSYAATKMPLIALGVATNNATIANFNIGRVGQFVRKAALYVNQTSVTPFLQ